MRRCCDMPGIESRHAVATSMGKSRRARPFRAFGASEPARSDVREASVGQLHAARSGWRGPTTAARQALALRCQRHGQGTGRECASQRGARRHRAAGLGVKVRGTVKVVDTNNGNVRLEHDRHLGLLAGLARVVHLAMRHCVPRGRQAALLRRHGQREQDHSQR